MELKDRRVTVVGLGVSGQAAAVFLVEKGAAVKVTEQNDDPGLQAKAQELGARGVECELGRHTEEFLEGTELLVLSPGVENGSLPVRWAEEKGIPVISEIELGYQFCKGKIIAVSGTNGKSTVTSLIGEMLKRGGRRSLVCGNIGTPFTSLVSAATEDDIIVLEISSFQLERIEGFRPHVAVMLNITEDHLDRYRDFDEYMGAKLKLFANQKSDDYAILNYDQVRLRNSTKGSLRSGTMYFSKHRLSQGHDGAYIENGELVVRQNGRYVWLATRENLSLDGEHNLENFLAAGLASLVVGTEADAINDVMLTFKPLNHRFEFIGIVDGVKFVDDSKATNVDSVLRALQSSPKGIVLIAGGRDKGGDYKILTKQVKDKVKSIFLIGEAKEKIADALSNTVPISFAADMKDAVKAAFEKSKNGDTVLLSPMCSSFDMFKDYKERGEVFRQAVKELRT